jgi:hypothetical protein
MITNEQWDVFFLEMEREGNISAAAKVSGIARSTVYERLAAEDPEWMARFDDAHKAMCDRIRAAYFRRAIEGVDEPVFQMGVQVGTIRRYSDPLLMALGKAHMPDLFRERTATELTGPGGGPIQSESRVVALPTIEEEKPE